MSFLEDSQNRSYYNYFNGSSDPSEPSDSGSDGFFGLFYKENRPLPPIDYNIFIIAGIRDDRDDIGRVRPTRER